MSEKVGVYSGMATVRALARVRCLLNLEAIPCILLPLIRPYHLESNSMRSDFQDKSVKKRLLSFYCVLVTGWNPK